MFRQINPRTENRLMKHIARSFGLLFVLALASGSLSAAGLTQRSSKQFEFAPGVKYSLGETEYILEAQGIDTAGNRIYVKSQLEFPLDGFMVGGTMRFTVDPLDPKPWFIEAGAFTNLTDPKGVMRDRDWSNSWQSPSGVDVYLGSVMEVSNTESDAQMNSVLLNFRFGKAVAMTEKSEVDLFAGFRYHRIDQKIIGLKGFQYNTDGDSLFYFDLPGLRGIDYTINYYLPHAGIEGALALGENASMKAHGAYAIVLVNDRDDHLLRQKISTSSLTGNGFIGGGEITFAMSRGRKTPVYLTLSGEFAYYSASGTQTQEFYDNDPSTPPKISGIPYTIHSTQGRIGMDVAFRF